ncbi:MAG: AMP-binding protein [Acidimicrobiales bacterium]|jgi:O-succinylbenzoic acid--CoA ligase
MRPLLALDFGLGPELELAIRDRVLRGEAFCVLDQRLSDRGQYAALDVLGATAVIDAQGPHPRESGRDVEDDIGLVMLTSGSSSDPKAVQLTWEALQASADMTQMALRADGAPVWFPCLPASHIGGLAVLLRAIMSDGALVWDDVSQIENAPTRGATHVAVVRALLARHDLSAYNTILLGGARPPTQMDANVVTTWGMTETGSGIVYNGYALAGVDVAQAEGELIVRSPTLFSSYRNSARPRVTGPDGMSNWFPTGDAGSVDNGRVSVRGRLGFVINTGGEKLWPEDLETAIATIAGVHDVAVTSVDDPEWGQRVVALVVRDGRDLDDAISATATERIGPWAKPKEVRYVAAIPRTNNGKIKRSELTHLL